MAATKTRKNVAPAKRGAKPRSPAPKPTAKASTPKTTRRVKTVALELPHDLHRALGEQPVATITALLKLRKALGSVSPEQLLANPFLAVTLDATAKYQPFATSSLSGLKPWRGTERELLDEAVKLSGRRPDQIAHTGLLREAANEVQTDFRRRHTAPDQKARGVEGVRDDVLTAAMRKLLDQGKPINESALRTMTGVAFRTCARFLERRGVALGLTKQSSGTWTPTTPATARETPEHA